MPNNFRWVFWHFGKLIRELRQTFTHFIFRQTETQTICCCFFTFLLKSKNETRLYWANIIDWIPDEMWFTESTEKDYTMLWHPPFPYMPKADFIKTLSCSFSDSYSRCEIKLCWHAGHFRSNHNFLAWKLVKGMDVFVFANKNVFRAQSCKNQNFFIVHNKAIMPFLYKGFQSFGLCIGCACFYWRVYRCACNRVSAKRPLGPNLCRLVKKKKKYDSRSPKKKKYDSRSPTISRYDQVPFWIFSLKMCSSPISTNEIL